MGKAFNCSWGIPVTVVQSVPKQIQNRSCRWPRGGNSSSYNVSLMLLAMSFAHAPLEMYTGYTLCSTQHNAQSDMTP